MAAALTSKKGARVSLVVVLAVIVALFGALTGIEANGGNAQAPAGSESTRAAELLKTFPDADKQSVIVVATAAEGAQLTAADEQALEELKPALENAASATTPGAKDSKDSKDAKGAADAKSAAQGPLVSEDGEAALLVVPVHASDDNSENAAQITAVRDAIAQHGPEGLTLQVTGGPAFGADVAKSFEGANFTLLAVTILIVAALLIITYRSPILWLLPLTVVGLADGLAGRAATALGAAFDLQFDAGIISVLVFGAGANYAMLMISRYREELAKVGPKQHRAALAAAWRATAPAILASNVTVVLSLATLAFAVIPGTRGLGATSALGLVIALAAVLFALPPLLAICGPRVFWPVVPDPQKRAKQRADLAENQAAQGEKRGFWHGIATAVMRRPVRALVAGGLLLAIMGAGLAGTTVGLTQVEKFRVPSESAQGLETLAKHYPAGEAQPTLIVANTERASEVIDAVRGVEGVVRVHPAGTTADNQLTKIMVTGEYAPGTAQALDQIDALRAKAHAVDDADALVGGGIATDFDARAGNARDFRVVVPLILGISFVVLVALTRSLVAPITLLAVNVASAAAAIGAGAWLSRVLFDQHALDLQVPLLSFLFLVALGIDYTIFLVHRARSEATRLALAGEGSPTREGMALAVGHTGAVITSAGIVLAGVFAALGVLPLVTLGQLGLIVGVGVIVDTLVVRTVIVPALFTLIGDRVWWPGKLQPRGANTRATRPQRAE